MRLPLVQRVRRQARVPGGGLDVGLLVGRGPFPGATVVAEAVQEHDRLSPQAHLLAFRAADVTPAAPDRVTAARASAGRRGGAGRSASAQNLRSWSAGRRSPSSALRARLARTRTPLTASAAGQEDAQHHADATAVMPADTARPPSATQRNHKGYPSCDRRRQISDSAVTSRVDSGRRQGTDCSVLGRVQRGS